jgi:uncharacterized protein YegP (UPF0339 family)
MSAVKLGPAVNKEGTMAEPEFEIYKDKDDEYRWRLQDSNNKIIADSAEGYTRKESVERAIPNVKDAVARAVINDRT